ncbi:coilin isoform X2 [Mixophyes fleayi]|uniref:coilin isoform X2 n=1 Tax=Mixophyes fleayi TaxID=3061075 RepID=UPI003F4D8E58
MASSDRVPPFSKMAAAARGDVRVRLMFEYPPPAIPESCMFWILLDTQRCRVVTDLTSIIRQRFFYSHRGALSLYVDDCLLLPGENIRVIRDNDSIRVKWDETYPEEDVDNSPSKANPPKKSKKRHRQKSEDESEEYTGLKHKKQKRLQSLASDTDIVEKVRKEKKKKKKVISDKKIVQSEQVSESPRKKSVKENKKHKEPSPVKESRTNLPKPNCEPQNKRLRPSSSSDSSLSSSDSDRESTTVLKKPLKTQDKPSSNVSITKTLISSSGKTVRKESSSSDSDSSEKGNTKKSVKEATVTPLAGTSEKPLEKNVTSSSDSSDSDNFVIKKPIAVPPVPGAVSPCITNGHVAKSTNQQGPLHNPGALGRGIGRGRGTDNIPWRGRGFRGRGDFRNQGRGRGDGNQFFYNSDTQMLKEQQLNEPATNTSILIQLLSHKNLDGEGSTYITHYNLWST